MALAVKIELFRRGCFDFITTRDGVKHEKQDEALRILTDVDHVEILYGGAAGGAAPFQPMRASKKCPYPEIRARRRFYWACDIFPVSRRHICRASFS